jgi:transcriptional regulator with XRE-family HTH domain
MFLISEKREESQMKLDGHGVKAARKEAQKTTAELAVAAGMSAAWVMKLEASHSHDVNDHIAKAMAKFLGVGTKDIEAKSQH